MPRAHIWIAALLSGPLIAAEAVHAADGRREISQSSIDVAGGFPLVIGETAAWILTSNLYVPDGVTTAVVVQAPGASLDLNGFSITGPVTCTSFPCAGAGGGIGVLIAAPGVSVVGGRISGVGDLGVDARFVSGTRVEQVLAAGNGGGGIAVGVDGLVRGCQALGNGGVGISAGDRTGLSENVSSSNQGVSFQGGIATGGNACDDDRCRSLGERRFFLDGSSSTGSQPLARCGVGYHFASVRELRDSSGLVYSQLLGVASDDGLGPPGNVAGWVRTGDSAVFGTSNCLGWTSASSSQSGMTLRLADSDALNDPATRSSPWILASLPCNLLSPTWCIQD